MRKRRNAKTIQALILKTLRAAGPEGLRTVDITTATNQQNPGATKQLRALQTEKVITRDPNSQRWMLREVTAPTPAPAPHKNGAPQVENETRREVVQLLEGERDSLTAQIQHLTERRQYVFDLIEKLG